jgi:hypothetical protein
MPHGACAPPLLMHQLLLLPLLQPPLLLKGL